MVCQAENGGMIRETRDGAQFRLLSSFNQDTSHTLNTGERMPRIRGVDWNGPATA